MMAKPTPAARFCNCLLACIVAAVSLCGAAEAPPPETTEQRDTRMAWWRQARFGMFIHWGLYAVLAGEHKGRRVGGIGEWIMHRAKIPIPEYEKLVPQFNPVKFNAGQWAQIAKDAGMRYMVITSKHHDGFCIFDSKLTDYDIMATPFKRDILKELAEACRKKDVRFGFYHSIMDWHHPDQNRSFPRYEQHLRGQVAELLTHYGRIDVMWFDGEWIRQWNRDKGRSLLALCRKLQPAVVVNNRVGKRKRDDGDFGTPEQTIPATGIPGHDWETCMTMNGTWGWKHYDHNWKSTAVLLRNLIDIASKGGNFLLNVGPTPEGTIPEPSVVRLREMGRWLKANGEAVYGTTASPFKRLPWGRCTAKPGKLFLHVFAWPKDGKLVVAGLGNKVTRAWLLASQSELKFEAADGKLTIALPAEMPDKIATVVAVEIEGAPEITASLIRQAADGTVALPAPEATLHGSRLQYEGDKNCVGFWTDAGDWVSWDFRLDKPGTFAIELTFACDETSGGSQFVIACGGQKLTGTIEPTGSWTKFAKKRLATIELKQPGKHTLTVKATKKPRLGVMNLRAIVLRPAQ
jgi:alpha-L-fucosidase